MSESKVVVQYRSPNGMVIEERELPTPPQLGEWVKIKGVTWNVTSTTTEISQGRTVVSAWVES